MSRILLIDAMAGLYRGFYGSKIERNSHGEPINALHRYLKIVHSYQLEYPCDDIIFCEDAPRDTLLRKQLFTNYKSGRKPPPEELTFQKNILFGFLRKIGFTVVGVNGYEADDIIGTMSQRLSDDGHHVLIASSDKDMYQLLTNDRIAYIRHKPAEKTQELLYRDDIKRQYGYWPEQVIDLKVLMGDKSDNIAGIPGITPKRAVEMLQRYGSLNGIIEKSEKTDLIAKQICGYAHKHSKDIKRTRELIKIVRDIPPEIISKQLAYRVTKEVQIETLERYQVMSMEEFEQLSFYPFLEKHLLPSSS